MLTLMVCRSTSRLEEPTMSRWLPSLTRMVLVVASHPSKRSRGYGNLHTAALAGFQVNAGKAAEGLHGAVGIGRILHIDLHHFSPIALAGVRDLHIELSIFISGLSESE